MAKRVLKGERLSFEEAKSLFDAVFDGQYPTEVVAGVLVAMSLRGETPEEVAAAIEAADERKLRVEHGVSPVVDTCGTGGDGSSTFNVSTASSLVVRALGLAVAKHGNRAVTGKMGSADILERLGVRICKSPSEARRELEGRRYAFLFAPGFHPAFAKVAGVRRALGVPTIFNLLGPQVNPCRVDAQVIGVYSPAKARVVAEALSLLGRKGRVVVCAEDGLDEVNTEGSTLVFEVDGGVKHWRFEAAKLMGREFPIPRIEDEEQGEKVFLGAISGKNREAASAAALNAAFALYAAGVASVEEGYGMAMRAIDEGAVVDVLRELSNGVS